MGNIAYNFNDIRNPQLRALIEEIMDIVAGHDHDGVNAKLVTGTAPAADSVTNAMIKSDAGIVSTKLAAAVQASLALADSAIQVAAGITPGTPVNAVGSYDTLNVTGVVIDGETFTVNATDIYEFCADAAQGVTAPGNLPVDIEAHATKSACKLTIDTQVTLGDFMNVGGVLYTFASVASTKGEGDISIGTDLATGQAAIVAAINGTDGHNTANPVATAAAFTGGGATESIITALIGGTAGDAYVCTSTFTTGTNQFDAATFGTEVAGVDCIAANAILAIAISVAANDTVGIGAVDAAGDTMTFTMDTLGTAGDGITLTKVMANGAFVGGVTAGGVDGTVGAIWASFIDTAYIYYAIAANTIADANWRRVSLGAVY